MTSEGRYQRKARRAEATGWENGRLSRSARSYTRWVKSFQNVVAYDSWGFKYYAFNRPVLIKKGGKP